MRRYILIICLLTAGLSAQSALPISAETRTGLEVTIYNNNLGLVKETRTFNLPSLAAGWNCCWRRWPPGSSRRRCCR